MQKTRDHLILMGQAVFVICVVLILANFKPVEREYSHIPIKGDDGVVDYGKVTEIVQEEVAVIPIPQNGQDGYTPVKGVDYFDGEDGKDAEPVDYNAIHSFIEQKVQEAFDAQKNLLPPILDIEYQNNPKNGTREWRLIGDDSWILCLPKDNCL
jgi:hypothetical protein